MATIKVISSKIKRLCALSDVALKCSDSSSKYGSTGLTFAYIGAAAVATSTAYYYMQKYMDGSFRLANEILNDGDIDLASDYVAQDPGVTLGQINNVAMIGNGTVEPTADGNAPDGAYAPVETPVVRYDLDPVDEKNHRRVKKRMPYVQGVVAEVKVRFGTPSQTAANDRAVRRFASEIMRKHGIRFSEVRRLLPIIVNAVFVPDKWELKAARMLASPGVGLLRAEYSALQAITNFKGF